MPLITLKDVLKQDDGVITLKNINLTINSGSQIGIKMSPEETKQLFDLITGQTTVSSGNIECQTTSIISELNEDGLYEKMTVARYIKTFKKIANYQDDINQHIEHFSLQDIWQTKINQLTPNQKKRVSLFRMFILSPKLLLIESPLINANDDGIKLYLKAVDYLRSQNITILFSSFYIEELLLLCKDVYRYNGATGLEKIEVEDESTAEESANTKEFQPSKVFKVACKMADKTIYFSPNEIDFIESINSVSNIRIGDDYYPSNLTMNELENKLTHFGFFRCHRSYLVNLQQISELISYSRNSYTLILKRPAKEKLPLSRAKVEELRQLIES